MLVLVLIFWNRPWARKALLATLIFITVLHFGPVLYLARHGLESRYPPITDPLQVEPYDAIVVLKSSVIPTGGLIPFPTMSESMFRRLEEAWRLYEILPKPIIISGGHVDPFTHSRDKNKIVPDYLLQWGVPPEHIISESNSRDTYESAMEVKKILDRNGWKRYLLVTSAIHMPRSILAFQRVVPEPIPAPGDFTLGERQFSPLGLFPSEDAAEQISSTLHEYIGLINYRWRNWYYIN